MPIAITAPETKQALVNVTEQIYKYINKGKISLLVLLNLTKAFDSLKHEFLLNKLVRLNIGSTWFESYFHDRTHSVKIDKIMSEAKSNLYGVTQRSILAIRGAQGVLPCVGWGVRPVNWIYRL